MFADDKVKTPCGFRVTNFIHFRRARNAFASGANSNVYDHRAYFNIVRCIQTRVDHFQEYSSILSDTEWLSIILDFIIFVIASIFC